MTPVFINGIVLGDSEVGLLKEKNIDALKTLIAQACELVGSDHYDKNITQGVLIQILCSLPSFVRSIEVRDPKREIYLMVQREVDTQSSNEPLNLVLNPSDPSQSTLISFVSDMSSPSFE